MARLSGRAGAKRFDPRSKGNVSEGRATLRGPPLAHCGSHCCANCITTGSGRDLPSVPRNSVSRGRVPALHNATGNCTACNTAVTHPRRPNATFALSDPLSKVLLFRKSSRSSSALLIQSVIRLSTTVNWALNFISRINISSICDELETNSSRMSRDWPSDKNGAPLGRINMEQGYVYCL